MSSNGGEGGRSSIGGMPTPGEFAGQALSASLSQMPNLSGPERALLACVERMIPEMASIRGEMDKERRVSEELRNENEGLRQELEMVRVELECNRQELTRANQTLTSMDIVERRLNSNVQNYSQQQMSAKRIKREIVDEPHQFQIQEQFEIEPKNIKRQNQPFATDVVYFNPFTNLSYPSASVNPPKQKSPHGDTPSSSGNKILRQFDQRQLQQDDDSLMERQFFQFHQQQQQKIMAENHPKTQEKRKGKKERNIEKEKGNMKIHNKDDKHSPLPPQIYMIAKAHKQKKTNIYLTASAQLNQRQISSIADKISNQKSQNKEKSKRTRQKVKLRMIIEKMLSIDRDAFMAESNNMWDQQLLNFWPSTSNTH